MIEYSPFDKCNGCRYEGSGQVNMPCLACTFGSHYKKAPMTNYISSGRPRISYAAFYNDMISDLKYAKGKAEKMRVGSLEIKKVIFNEPATIVYWEDGTKTVVKTQGGEPFDPEKGLAMAICKKAYGNEGNYFNNIKKWTKNYEPKPIEFVPEFVVPSIKLNIPDSFREEVTRAAKAIMKMGEKQ